MAPLLLAAPTSRQQIDSTCSPLPAGEWRRSDGQEVAWSEADPFTSPYLEARLAEEAAARAAEKARKAEAKARAAANAQQQQAKAPKPVAAQSRQKPQPKPAAPPAAPKPPRTITLIYRGMLTHIDGSSVAIVEHVENGRTALLKPGESIEGFSMVQLDRAAAMLTTADGKTEHALPIGKRIKLSPGKQKQ